MVLSKMKTDFEIMTLRLSRHVRAPLVNPDGAVAHGGVVRLDQVPERLSYGESVLAQRNRQSKRRAEYVIDIPCGALSD